MTAVLAPVPVQKFFDNNGFPLFKGTLTTYAAGTTTPQATYVDSTQTTQNTNPIQLNFRGECNLWLDPTKSYKFLLKDFFGNTVWTVDNIPGGALTSDLLPIPTNTVNLGGPSNTFKNLYLGASGQPLLDTTSGNILFYARTSGEIAAGVNPTNFDYPPGHILRYGTNTTPGTTDMRGAFATAASVCTKTGLVLQIPDQNILINTNGGTINLSYLTIQGTGVTDGSATPAAAGSVLSFIGTTNSPFTVGPGVTFDGVGFFYPNQVDTPTPTVYPPTLSMSIGIAGAINFVYIQNCTVFNAYRFFVDTDSTGAIGHVFLLNNTIYGILTCFELAYNAEIITIEGNEFTFGHFLAATEGGLRGFTRANGSVAIVTRTDGLTFSGNVLFGYLNGIHYATSATLCQLTSILGNYFDQCLFPILVDGTGNISQFSIVGNSFNALNTQDHTQIGNCIKISTSGTVAKEVLTISSNIFSLCTGDFINISGNTPNRAYTIVGNNCTVWGAFQAAGTFSCLNITGNATSYNAVGNEFIAASGAGATLNGISGTCADIEVVGNKFGTCAAAITGQWNSALVIGNQSFSTSGAASNNYTGGAHIDFGNVWDKDAVKVTGFGSPTGQAVVANFPGATATLLQTSQTVAEILTILKTNGIIAA